LDDTAALGSIIEADSARKGDEMQQLYDLADRYPAIPIGMFLVFVALAVMNRKRAPKAAPRNVGFLDRPILDLGGIPFSGKMATEGIFTCAELGWGKTFLVFQRVLRAYVQAGMGGYILGAKAEDLRTVIQLFRTLGAERRLAVVGPRHRHRINCFEALTSIAPPDGVEEEIIGFFSSLLEIESRTASRSGGENAQFFVAHGQRLLGAILTCLRLAGERMAADTIYRFLVSLPQTPAQLADANWQQHSYANQCVKKAFSAPKTPRQQTDYDNATLYLWRELASLNDRTRSSIVSTVSAMLSKLLRGWMADIWSSTTTVRFQDAFKGGWLYFDTSPLEYGEYGVYSLVTAKHLAQRAVLRRRIRRGSRAVALMGDEWQAIFVTADRDYQAVCRSQLGCTWAATQNATGLFSVLGGGPAAEAQAKSWIALFGAKVFGANTDWATNTYASELCGMQRETLLTGNTAPSEQTSVFDALMGNANVSSGWNEQYQPVVRPEHFVSLRKPEPPLNEADAVVIMPRLQQVIGRHWAQVTLRPGG
jgi:hypothetical protein